MARRDRWCGRVWRSICAGLASAAVVLLVAGANAQDARPSEPQTHQEQTDAHLRQLLEIARGSGPDSEDAQRELIARLGEASPYLHGEAAFYLALSLERRSELAQAEKLLLHALERSSVRAVGWANNLNFSLSRVLWLRNDFAGALAAADELRASIADISDDETRRLTTDLEIEIRARILLDLGLISAAWRAFSLHSGSARDEFRTHIPVFLKARLHLESDRAEDALKTLRSFVAEADLNANVQAYARSMVAEALVANGEVEAGLNAIDEVIAAGNLQVKTSRWLRLIAAEAYLERGEEEAAASQVSRLHAPDLSHIYRVRYLAIQSRLAEASEADENERVDILAQLRAAFDSFLGVWRDVPLVEHGIGFLATRRRRAVLDVLVRAELTSAPESKGEKDMSSGAKAALQHVLNSQTCGQLARKLGTKMITVAEIQAEMATHGGGIILLVPVADSTLLFVVESDRVGFERLPGRKSLRKSARAAEIALSDRNLPTSELERTLRTFTEQLLPESTRVRIEQWPLTCFDGLELLTTLPPELLCTRSGDWLGCTQRIITFPSTAVASRLARRKTNHKDGLLCLLNPTQPVRKDEQNRKRLAPLEFQSDELAALKKLSGRAVPIRIAEGTEATLGTAKAKPCAWLWVHAHGLLDRARALPAGLNLPLSKNEPRAVWPADIEALYRHETGPKVVFLGACEAGFGTRRMGDDGAYPLGAAFLVAGAKSVVLSTREIHHVPAKALAIHFWRALDDGKSVSESMRLARAALRDAGQDPREFGVFSLFGSE